MSSFLSLFIIFHFQLLFSHKPFCYPELFITTVSFYEIPMTLTPFSSFFHFLSGPSLSHRTLPSLLFSCISSFFFSSATPISKTTMNSQFENILSILSYLTFKEFVVTTLIESNYVEFFLFLFLKTKL